MLSGRDLALIWRMQSERRLSLVELSAAGLSPTDVAAVVAALCRVQMGGDAAAPASTKLQLEDVSLDRTGTLHLAPGVMPTVPELGTLLEQLLADIRRAGSTRFAPGLLVLAARATGRIDLAPLPSRETLAGALARFEPPDAAQALRDLFARVDAMRRRPAERPAIASRRPERPAFARRRRGWIAAAAVLALLGGFAAGVLFTPARSDRVTDATEVILRPPAGTAKPRTEPKAEKAGPRKPVPSSREAPAATSGRATPAPTRGELGEPQPLVGPREAEGTKAFSPSFDQNGSAVFFHAETATGTALKRAEPGDDGVLHVVTILDDNAKNYHVQLAPDGRSVAFDSDRDGVRGVYVARADGTRVRRVSGEGYAAVPTWSPDGRRLALLRAENDRPGVWNLWLLELASGEMTRLTSHRYGQVWGGAWFPSGSRLAYSHEDQLFLMDLDSGRRMAYPSPVKGRLIRTPAVSPDGRWIIFQVSRDGAWLLHLDNGSMRRVLEDPTAEEFTWSPDGSRVAFHSRRRGDWGLWMMAAR